MTSHIVPMAVLMAILLVTSGCVTESSGGLPPPASTSDRVQAHLDLARGYLEQQDFERAKPALETALEIDPRNVGAHVLSAVVLHAQNDDELAEEHYKTALRIDPRNAQALNNYGTFLYAMERYEDATGPLSRLVEDTSYRARSQAFENLGMAQLQMGDGEAAQASFARSIELNPRQPGATLELAYLAIEQRDYEQANVLLRNFRNMAGRNARSLCLGVKVGLGLNDQDLVASNSIALKNLFPAVADQCLEQR